MVIKKFEYTLLNKFSKKIEIISKNFFFLNIASKATYIIHRAIKILTKNKSQFTSSTKTKSQIQGSGHKPWKQKGSGNARAGSTRSPLWRGGGITFGPKPRFISKKLNKKEKKLAIRTIIFNKNIYQKLNIYNKIDFENNQISSFLNYLSDNYKNKKVLIIIPKLNINLQLSIQNWKNFNYLLANQLNIMELIKANIIILDKIALEIIKETYCD